jgi:hypothetical protein
MCTASNPFAALRGMLGEQDDAKPLRVIAYRKTSEA